MKLEIWFGVLPGNQLMQKYHMSESSEIWIDVDLEHMGANIRANILGLIILGLIILGLGR